MDFPDMFNQPDTNDCHTDEDVGMAPFTFMQRIRQRSSLPPARQRAKDHPDRTLVYTIPHFDLMTEATRINDATQRGGYPHHISTINMREAAFQVLVNRLTDIATAQNLFDYEFYHSPLDGTAVEITFLFPSVKDAIVFKMSLS
jgi:hypothetical protein